MSYLDKSLEEIHAALKEDKVTSSELTKEALKRAHASQEELNSFVTILDDVKESDVTDNVLSGIPCAIKDNFSTNGVLTTASSNILSNKLNPNLLFLGTNFIIHSSLQLSSYFN